VQAFVLEAEHSQASASTEGETDMGLRKRVVRQFGNPRGTLGRLVGFVMSHRSSNLERTRWAISLLHVQPNDCALEIGFGPGVAIRMLAELATDGVVYGVDHSPLMLEQASRRNQDFIRAGRVTLMVASASRLPSFERRFDKVLDINAFQFWEDQSGTLAQVRQRMQPEGIIAIVHQPRNARATKEDAIKAGERISKHLSASGFQEVRVELKEMNPVAVVCVIGRNT
jgi:SAM-dependent methyltransferase